MLIVGTDDEIQIAGARLVAARHGLRDPVHIDILRPGSLENVDDIIYFAHGMTQSGNRTSFVARVRRAVLSEMGYRPGGRGSALATPEEMAQRFSQLGLQGGEIRLHVCNSAWFGNQLRKQLSRRSIPTTIFAPRGGVGSLLRGKEGIPIVIERRFIDIVEHPAGQGWVRFPRR